ncbi:MAG: glycosyltransferase family 2 protein [Synergistaceae bacterium]|nr:glycosyltransferase family 2 protein [Synergistaceae bacterium]
MQNRAIIDQTRLDLTRPDQTALHGLISVIIPVYNTEKYLAKCVDSVTAQTYNNLEILLIDDGSADSSGKICDDYARKDSRVRVIHQTNKGLAEVRNVGIREAKGEWVLFVDSDDWIAPETIEACLGYAREYDAEIVCFRFVLEYEDGAKRHTVRKHYPPLLMNSREALSIVLFPQSMVDVISCNKLIKSGLLRGIEYPIGRISEDIYTTYKILAKTDRILCVSGEYYHYLRRTGSIGHYSFSPRTYDITDAAQKCYDFALSLNKGDKSAVRNLSAGLWCWKLHVANYMIKAGTPDMGYISQIQGEIRPLAVIICRHIRFITKAQLIVFKFSLKLYSLIYLKFRRDKS